MTKKRKASSVLAMTLAAGTIFSAPIYGHAQEGVQPAEEQEWAQTMNTENITKEHMQQLRSVDKQLYKIGEKLRIYQQEVDALNLESPEMKEDGEASEETIDLEQNKAYTEKFKSLEEHLYAVNNQLDSLASKGVPEEEVQEREYTATVLQVEVQTLLQTVSYEEPAPAPEEDVTEEPTPAPEEGVAEEPAPVPEEDIVEEPAPAPEEGTAQEPVSAAPVANEETVTEEGAIDERLDDLEQRLNELEEQVNTQNEEGQVL